MTAHRAAGRRAHPARPRPGLRRTIDAGRALVTVLLVCGGCAARVHVDPPDGGGDAACAERQQACAGVCVDVLSDPHHCGSCGATCGVAEVCGNGLCLAGCVPGTALCGRSCVDLASDRFHCGSCDRGCASDHTCISGECVPSCNPASCPGCCRANEGCAPGTADDRCGAGGAVCLDCAASGGVCQAGACALLTYAWQTGAWTDCSKSCDGGVRTRSVWCEGSNGVPVDDGPCGGPKPATSESCNSQPCCATAALVLARRCGGEAQVQWTNWGTNTGSAADQAACAAQCTSWASANALVQWCCELYEDSSPGTLWVCRVYDAYSTVAGGAQYASLGQCQSP
jgi:hypothetical protein